MDLPEFILELDKIDIPFPEEHVKTHVVKSDKALVIIFEAEHDLEVPEHSHKAQWGTVIEGELSLTIKGETKIYHAGDSYNIPSGAPHAAKLMAGSKVIDIFEEPERYPLRRV